MDNPALWDVERVLQELDLPQSKLPPTAAQAVRHHEIDGDCLVNLIKTDHGYNVLFDTLQASRLSQKLNLKRTVKSIQSRCQAVVGPTQVEPHLSWEESSVYDPSQWSVDQVVHELCSPPSKLPCTAADAIRHHQIDGACLVTHITNDRAYKLLYDTLQVTRMPQRLYLDHKIDRMKTRSRALAHQRDVIPGTHVERDLLDYPHQWDTERVVEELCSSQSKLPSSTADLLRDNCVDGDCLVSEVREDGDYEELFKTLQVTSLPQILYLHSKIDDMKQRSLAADSHIQVSNKKREAEDSSSLNSKRPKLESPSLPPTTVDSATQTVGTFENKPNSASLSHKNSGREEMHLESGDDEANIVQYSSTKQPVVKQPALQNVQHAKSDVDDATKKNTLNYSAFTDAVDGWAEKSWNATCDFFGCSRRATKVPVVGFLKDPDHYQAMGVWLMLTQQARQGVAGALLADEMGLGKSLQILMVILIRGYLIEMGNDIDENPNDHLSPEQSPGAKCPSRHKYGGMQCPCEEGSWAAKIADYAFDLPTIIFMPPALAGHWVDQVKAHIDFSHTSPARSFEFKVVHEEWCNANKNNPLNRRFVYQQKDFVSIKPDANKQLGEYPGGSRTSYFASNHFMGNGKFPKNMPVGMIVMDEVHRYKGSIDRTAPFRFLLNKDRQMGSPIFLYLVSGSLQALGPDAWRWAVEHFEMTKTGCAWDNYKSAVDD
ncbi:hypothetical protein PG988_003820 [Apiospora saccharicola]